VFDGRSHNRVSTKSDGSGGTEAALSISRWSSSNDAANASGSVNER